jgi:hypothetical protein
MATQYTCPVCFYSEMQDPIEMGSICPCCGTEFGFDDDGVSLDELRDQWVAANAPWFSRAIQPPPDWNPWMQLAFSGHDYTDRLQPQDTIIRDVAVPGVQVAVDVRLLAVA